MIHVSRTPEFFNCGNMNLFPDAFSDHNLESMASSRTRQRSHSYYNAEGKKPYGVDTQKEETCLRPRSRSFYSYETSELCSEDDIRHFTTSPTSKQMQSSLPKYQATKKEERDGDVSVVEFTSTKSKHKPNKQSPSRETCSKCHLKQVSMMTISEADNWEICSSSGMKYGQFVDWEKIDPEAAKKYQQILRSEHQQLKTMAREGFWAMPHTLRAKAYYHIIHSINSIRAVTPDRDVYYELTKKLFGEQKRSSHPVPKYMEDGEIPRYCLNKAGLNSAKKVLLCLGKYFIDMNFCPILPALVSLILHFSEDEAECFYSVSRLICYNDPNKRYIDQTFLTYRASCMTFGDLANKCCRGIRKLIASSHQNLFEFYSDWIMWIFADLPFTYAIRVLDVYLLEGYKVLYRLPVETVDFNNFRSSVVTGTEMRVIWAWIPERFALFSPFRLFSTAEHERTLASFYSHVEGHEPSVMIIKSVDEEVFGAFLSTDVAERRKQDSEELVYFGTGECLVFTLRPNMELYQRSMVNIMSPRASPEKLRGSISASPQASTNGNIPSSTTLTCPAETLQNPSYLMVTAPVEESMSAKQPKRPKEQEASKFIAGDDNRLIIGGDGGHALCLQRDLQGGYTEPCETFKSIALCKRDFKIQSLEVWGIQNSISISHCFPSKLQQWAQIPHLSLKQNLRRKVQK
uniref:TBC1 domain family member 24 n=1 Tax=Astatotilapia calliptera TaxID=8154 RepID=A0AAX7TXC8_ASTCA